MSVMEFDANRELCDGGPRFDASTIGGPLGAVMQTPTVHDICSDAPAEDEEKDGGDRSTTATEAATAVADKPELRLELAAGQRLAADRLDDGEKDSCQSKSPMSPTSSSSKLTLLATNLRVCVRSRLVHTTVSTCCYSY